MPFSTYRPWGQLQWLYERLGIPEWDFIGCLSPEDRTLAAWKFLGSSNALRHTEFIQVVDPPSRFSAQITAAIEGKCSTLAAAEKEPDAVMELDLFCRVDEIVNLAESFCADTAGNVLLDLSTFPKRFFFPLIRRFLDSEKVENLLACYTAAEAYATEALAEDPEPWKKLPLFPERYPEEDPDLLVVAVGFQALGLPEMMENGYVNAETKLLFPFPAAPPRFQRTWQVIRRLEEYMPDSPVEPKFLAGHDVPETFAYLRELTVDGSRYAVLAPYGPKPISLAMALFARLADCPVYYTQPTVYNPGYSIGIAETDGASQITSYCLKLNGHEVYTFGENEV